MARGPLGALLAAAHLLAPGPATTARIQGLIQQLDDSTGPHDTHLRPDSEERTRAAVDEAYADRSADAQPQVDEAT
ncbi:hypothetical protein [Streptomyces sp. NPDC057838]|uniref:hypothetical protein n=1 Tax=unclassified Streptomyces TaxID=2593676 RepID=UPI0036981D44